MSSGSEVVRRKRSEAAAPAPGLAPPTGSRQPDPAPRREPAAADPADVGEEVVHTSGEELYAPVQFNSFRVGPMSRRTVVRPGETVAQAYQRAAGDCEDAMLQEFNRKLDAYLERLTKVGREVQARRAR